MNCLFIWKHHTHACMCALWMHDQISNILKWCCFSSLHESSVCIVCVCLCAKGMYNGRSVPAQNGISYIRLSARWSGTKAGWHRPAHFTHVSETALPFPLLVKGRHYKDTTQINPSTFILFNNWHLSRMIIHISFMTSSGL